MFGRKFNHLALFGLVGLSLFLVGLLIFPKPKAANAQAVRFTVYLTDESGNPINPTQIPCISFELWNGNQLVRGQLYELLI